MSSSAAGKFQDHYSLLNLETNADSDTIQAAYSRLAQKYHPNNAETGDKAKFDSVNQAYEVLSDPALRAAFDKVKGVDHESGNPKFSGPGFFNALAQGAMLRSAILCVLYDRRRVKSAKPSLSIRHMDGIILATSEEMHLALWFLKKRAFVVNDDKSNMEISVEGMYFLEQNMPSAQDIMPFIRQDAIVDKDAAIMNQHAAVITPVPAKPVAAEAGSVLNALNRAILRNNAAEEVLSRSK